MAKRKKKAKRNPGGEYGPYFWARPAGGSRTGHYKTAKAAAAAARSAGYDGATVHTGDIRAAKLGAPVLTVRIKKAKRNPRQVRRRDITKTRSAGVISPKGRAARYVVELVGVARRRPVFFYLQPNGTPGAHKTAERFDQVAAALTRVNAIRSKLPKKIQIARIAVA